MTYTLDPEKAASVLARCVTDVFAETAFLDVRATADAPMADGAKVASIGVLSPLSCSVRLAFSQATLERIAGTLFDDDGSDRQSARKNAKDSMLAILNIISGSFLSNYFGAGTEFILELPQYHYSDDAIPGEQVSLLRMDAEGEPLEISLHSVRYRY